MSDHPVVFWELASLDGDKSMQFFKEVFGWESEYDEKTTIHYLAAGEAREQFFGGGIFTLAKAKLPFLAVYIKVDDINAKVSDVEAHGGHIVEPPLEIGNSRICLFNEPSGVTFAMIESKKKDD